MITILESAPYDPAFAKEENYGRDYMARISPRTAQTLCGDLPLPKVGHELTVRRTDVILGSVTLCVANVSGFFVVRSVYVPFLEWPPYFDIHLSRHEGTA